MMGTMFQKNQGGNDEEKDSAPEEEVGDPVQETLGVGDGEKDQENIMDEAVGCMGTSDYT